MFEELIETIQQAEKIQIFTGVDGRPLYSRPLHPEPRPEMVSNIVGYSLIGLITFIESVAQDDSYDLEFIKVCNPGRVEVLSRPNLHYGDRTTYYTALYPTPGVQPMTMTSWYPLARLLPLLQSQFEQTEVMAQLIEFLSHVNITDTVEMIDNGISQEVVIQQDVAKVAKAPLPKSINLVPYRTFSEAIQPTSPFVLRRKRDGRSVDFRLFPCDNGAWEIKAMESIADFIDRGLDSIYPTDGGIPKLPILI